MSENVKKDADYNDDGDFMSIPLGIEEEIYSIGEESTTKPHTPMDSERILELRRAREKEVEYDLMAMKGRELLFECRGKKKNVDKAYTMLSEAAEAGNKRAIYWLGMLYIREEKYLDIKKGLGLILRAANMENAEAQSQMAHFYMHGIYVEKNSEGAFLWYRMAAENGYAEAQNMLGKMYAKGIVVEQNGEEAYKWFKMAALNNYPAALYNLAGYYLYGVCVEKDISMAISLFRASAYEDPDEKRPIMRLRELGVSEEFTIEDNNRLFDKLSILILEGDEGFDGEYVW